MSNILSLGECHGPSELTRLDIVCVSALNQARRDVVDWIKSGKITVNEKSAKPAKLVGETDRIQWRDLAIANSEVSDDVGVEPTVIFEDDALIVLNKPIGWTVHKVNSGQKGPFLTDWLSSGWPSVFSAIEGSRPGIVHRLDRLTEGVMVIAKSAAVLENLKDQFKARTVEKKYYAAVKGNVLSDMLVIDQPITRSQKNRQKMIVSPDGKPGLSELRVIKRFHSMTLIEVLPKTGRTHQIRVHLDFIGHSVIGDPVYGKGGTRDGQRLQAYYLGFCHPLTHEPMTFSIPMSPRIVQIK